MTLAKSIIILTTIIMLNSGCSGDTIRKGVYQGIFEGARINNRGEFSPCERATRPDPDFDRYSGSDRSRLRTFRNNKPGL